MNMNNMNPMNMNQMVAPPAPEQPKKSKHLVLALLYQAWLFSAFNLWNIM